MNNTLTHDNALKLSFLTPIPTSYDGSKGKGAKYPGEIYPILSRLYKYLSIPNLSMCVSKKVRNKGVNMDRGRFWSIFEIFSRQTFPFFPSISTIKNMSPVSVTICAGDPSTNHSTNKKKIIIGIN